MATSEEELNLRKLINQELDKEKQKQAESLDLSASLVDSVKEVLGINTKRTTADSNLLKVNKQINTQILNQKTGLGSISEINKRIAKNQDVLNKGKVTERSLSKGLAIQARQAVFQGIALTDQINEKQKLIDEELVKTSEQGGIDFDRVNALKNQIAARENDLGILMESMSSGQQQLLFTKLNVKELEKQNAEREKELALAEELQEKLGVAGKLNKLIGAIPGLGDAATKALKEVTEELERAADVNEELPSKTKVAAMQFKALGKNLVKDLVDPTTLALGAITAIGKALMSVDKEAGEFAKNMGISYDESLALRGEMSKVSRNNKDILITSKELIKAQSELNEFFGQSVAFSGEIASEFASIQKRTGLSTKALGIFTRTAMESGVATEDVLVNIEKTRLEQNNLNKLSLSSKQIQEGIAEASNAFQLSVGKSVTELTKAFFASKQLGASFQQLEGLADNLLDFESSIQSELQAELLTGRQLNLEKARQAALDNDLVTLATEIKNQVGSAAEFGEMNRIQQEAIAKSIGMQRGELADVLMEQENINALQGIFGSGVESLSDAQKQYNKLKSEGRLTEEQTNALAEKGLADQMATASVAARFEAIILRVQEIFIGFAEPILGIVDGIASMVGGAEHLANILVGIAGTYALIKGYTLATSIYETAILARKMAQGSLDARALFLGKSKLVQTIGQAIASIFSGSATLGPFGIPLAIAGVAALTGAIASASALADDIAIPSGYGERMILGPEGSIALNNRDTIVAGTDLFKADDMTLSPEGTNTVVNNQNTTVDNTALVTKMDQLIAVNERILAKSSVIEMNGNQVGQEINTSERAIQ